MCLVGRRPSRGSVRASCLLGLSCVTSQRFGVVLLCCPACSHGARYLRACPRFERLLPLPGTPILGRLRGRYRGDERLGHRGRSEFYSVQASQSFVSLPRSTFVSEPRREVRREAAAWPGCSVACVGAEARARLASRACGLWVPLLATSGGGLVAVVVAAFPHDVSKCDSLTELAVTAWLCLVSVGVVGPDLCGPVLLLVSASVFSRFRGPVLGCQSIVAPTYVVFQPGGVSKVRGGSACRPLTPWRSEVAVLELGVGRVAEAAVAPCVVSSSESKRCELW
ncbi:hypothetical protein Taro_023885 [Colocasia esculenta]|uniref:Uncharacterized protein n=1 Tax=Colocasia esculenta TaxID=4460 RepID=A0A843VFT3_COLES|nr:hypothetical protein [Colocasia esculenta]